MFVPNYLFLQAKRQSKVIKGVWTQHYPFFQLVLHSPDIEAFPQSKCASLPADKPYITYGGGHNHQFARDFP
jgi:hypothetical protein